MEKDIVEIRSRKSSETFEFGKSLAGILKAGDVIALYGDLGSGKTVLVQGVCQGLGVREFVTSPSFTIIQEYSGKYPVAHFDVYRLESTRAIENLDLDGYFEKNGISLIEWAEHGEPFLPPDRFSVRFERVVENGKLVNMHRKIVLCGPKQRGLDRLYS